MRTVSLYDAAAMIPTAATLMGGFMGVGALEALVEEILRQRCGDLTVTANDPNVRSKCVRECSPVLTTSRPVDSLVHQFAVIGRPRGMATLFETAGVTIEDEMAATEPDLVTSADLTLMTRTKLADEAAIRASGEQT
jgi:hypothetical protein